MTPLVAQHVGWWMRHMTVSIPHRDDIAQEAALAEWRALADFDSSRGVKFSTFAWRRMHGACRAYLQAAGALRRTGTRSGLRPVATESVENFDLGHFDMPDGPLVLKQAWALLRDGYEGRGFTSGHAEVLARLDIGQTLAEAGAAVGVSRQRAHQLAQRVAESVSTGSVICPRTQPNYRQREDVKAKRREYQQKYRAKRKAAAT